MFGGVETAVLKPDKQGQSLGSSSEITLYSNIQSEPLEKGLQESYRMGNSYLPYNKP